MNPIKTVAKYIFKLLQKFNEGGLSMVEKQVLLQENEKTSCRLGEIVTKDVDDKGQLFKTHKEL